MKALRILAITAAIAAAPPVLAQDAPLPAVTVAPASLQQVSQTRTFSGRLVADQAINLMARVTGYLTAVGFEPGDSVAQGDVLFSIEPDQYDAAVKQAQGSLSAARATVVDARIERDRQAQLVARESVAQTVLDSAEAALGRATGAVDQAEAALEIARLNQSYASVTAPFAGRIGLRNVDPGALVGPETGALATLTRLDPIHVTFSAPTAEYRNLMEAIQAGQVSADDAVTITLANGRTYAAPGKLDFVDSTVNAGTDSVRLRATFANPDGTLLHDELVRVQLVTSAADPVLTVPMRAVQRDLVGDYVMVVDAQGKVDQRRIRVARTAGDVAVIAEGLPEGARVITEGMNKVRAGITVDAAEAEGN